MIEAGQAVYFIENRGMDPVIKFGIVRGLWEERGFYHYAVDFLSIKEHRYIKGIPFDEFTNTEWRKIPKQKQYLESIGVDTSEMDEQAIKEANTGSHVFLKGTISILDAIEDVDIFINKD